MSISFILNIDTINMLILFAMISTPTFIVLFIKNK